jgi:hypothetical protein
LAQATPLKVPYGTEDYGTFKAEKFNMFDTEELAVYSELRNRANDASSGIKIEMMREYTRKETTRDGDSSTTTEEIILVVQYWEKTPKRNKGDSDEEVKEASKDWSSERSVG